MSVQPALAEAVALSEMQMAAFEGQHRERQLIQAFTRHKKKKKAVRPLFVGRFMSTVLQGHVLYPLSSCHRIQRTLQRFRKHQDRHKGEEMT